MYENPLDKIQKYYEEFTKTDKEIAYFFINHAHDAITGMTSDDVAKVTKTSKAAISRFCQKVGYNGFSDFRFDLARALISNDEVTSSDKKNPLIEISELYSSYIANIHNTLNIEELEKVAKVIAKANRIKIFGRNRTYNSALQFKQRLNRVGIDSEAVGDTIVLTDVVSILKPNDVSIIFTTTDNTKIYASYIKLMKETNCKIVVVTMNPNLPFKKMVDHYLVLPRISKNTSLSFLDDQPLFMVFIEILLNLIAKNLHD